MYLYELTTPVEHKYGGTLTQEEQDRCTRQTHLSSPRWSPYSQRPARVENICGKFVVRVADSPAMAPGPGTVGAGMGTKSAYGAGGSDEEVADLAGGSTLELGVNADPAFDQTLSSKYVSCLNGHHLDSRLDSVCFRMDSPFGKQYEIFHLAGHVTIRSTPGLPRSVIFKGVKGVSGTRELMKGLFFNEDVGVGKPEQTAGLLRPADSLVIPLVHMGVVSSCLGVRLQTSHNCYLENKIFSGVGSMQGGWMRVESRSMDQCNIVRLAVCDWRGLLPEMLLPTSNDLVITGKGSVMHRMAWTGVEWTEDNERAVLDACTWVAEQIASVC